MRTLNPRKVRQGYRLVIEVCQLGENAEAWPVRLANGLLEIFDARVVGLSWACLPEVPGGYNVAEIQKHWGFTEEQEELWVKQYLAPDKTFRSEFLRRLVNIPARFVTVRRQDVMTDSEWYALPEVDQVHRFCDIDANLASFFVIPQLRRLFGIGIHRSWGSPQFDVGERRLLKLIHVELARAWRERLRHPNDHAEEINQLPDRLRQVLWLTCAGLSEKQVAYRLGISPHTVHEHVRRLFQRLSVTSRAELVARATTRGQPLVYPAVPLGREYPF